MYGQLMYERNGLEEKQERMNFTKSHVVTTDESYETGLLLHIICKDQFQVDISKNGRINDPQFYRE